MMRVHRTRAILAGILGTLTFDVLGLLLSAMMSNPTWWDVPRLLGMKTGFGLPGGVLQHYGNGAIPAVIFAAIVLSLWGTPHWFRALLSITVQTVTGVRFFMMPLLDMGVAGVHSPMGMMMPVASFLRHRVYGLVVAGLYPAALYAGSPTSAE